MPVRKSTSRRATKAAFEVTPEMVEAFDIYVASAPQPHAQWPEHWILHDLLSAAGALPIQLCPPCCFHPGDAGIRWQHRPWAVAIYRRLSNAQIQGAGG